jgi:hypothetical protein
MVVILYLAGGVYCVFRFLLESMALPAAVKLGLCTASLNSCWRAWLCLLLL